LVFLSGYRSPVCKDKWNESGFEAGFFVEIWLTSVKC
jgi:hypothetical protein